MMSIENRIKKKLEDNLSPLVLDLQNVSYKHEGHAGHDGSNDTHFELYLVSEKFEGIDKITRQRMVYSLLDEEFKDGLHALSVKVLSKKEAGL